MAGTIARWALALAVASGGPVAAVATPAAALPPTAATAPPATVVYRCTSPQGAVALQDDPCPAGHRSERREIPAYAPPPAPAPVPAAATNTAPPTEDEAAAVVAEAPATPRIEFSAGEAPPPRPLSMPPSLWRCTDLNGKDRLVDDYDPQPRCVPLSVLGVDLSRAPPSAANLCRMVEDHCVELSGEAACAAWKERHEAAVSALRHAFSDSAAQRRHERDRAEAVLKADCGG